MITSQFIATLLDRSIYFILPFLVGISALLLFKQLAHKYGIVDKPTERKAHDGNIPLVGGPAIYLAMLVGSVLLVPQFQVLFFLLLCLVILFLGVADDLLDLPALLRIFVQALVAFAMVTQAGLNIENVGNLFGFGMVEMHGVFSIAFTIMCTIGVINSVNMIDGVDGLAGSVLGISFGAMAVLAWYGTDWVSAKMLVIYVGSIAAFLCFNARIVISKAQIFMGDSGSMLLGFIMVWFFIRTTQGNLAPISPVVAGWLFGLPLLDTIVVMISRLRARTSPFKAGRDHFHHRLLDSGFSVNQTVLSVCLIHSLFVVTGMLANNYRQFEPFLFWGFVLCVLLHYFVITPRLILRRKADH